MKVTASRQNGVNWKRILFSKPSYAGKFVHVAMKMCKEFLIQGQNILCTSFFFPQFLFFLRILFYQDLYPCISRSPKFIFRGTRANSRTEAERKENMYVNKFVQGRRGWCEPCSEKKGEGGGFSAPFYSPRAAAAAKEKRGEKETKFAYWTGEEKKEEKGESCCCTLLLRFIPKKRRFFLLLSLFPYVVAAKWGSFSLLIFFGRLYFRIFGFLRKGKVSKNNYET